MIKHDGTRTMVVAILELVRLVAAAIAGFLGGTV